MKSTPYSSINTHEIKTSALTRKSFSIFTRLNLQSRSHTDRSMPSGMLESLSRSWMAASSDDLAWACCLAVDGRSAKGLGRPWSDVEGAAAGVSNPFRRGILNYGK
jgi:hypothetical protein